MKALLILFLASSAMAATELREYGKSSEIKFPLFDLTGKNLATNATCEAGDVVLVGPPTPSKPCFVPVPGAPGTYSLSVSATDLTLKDLSVTIRDKTATKAWLDEVIVVSTYGDPGARHPSFPVDVGSGGGTTTIPPDPPEPVPPPEVIDPIFYGNVSTGSFSPTVTQFEAQVTNSTKTRVQTVPPNLQVLWLNGPQAGRSYLIEGQAKAGTARIRLTVNQMPQPPRSGDQFMIWEPY